MTCSMEKLMSNGFCGDGNQDNSFAGHECPQDSRCVQWNVSPCPRGHKTQPAGCFWRNSNTNMCHYPGGKYRECPLYHGLEMENESLNQGIRTEPAGVQIADVQRKRKPWGIDSVDDDAAWLFQDDEGDDDAEEPAWVDHDLLNSDLAWACQEFNPAPTSPYDSLNEVLHDAYEQAANGKGKERHATDNAYKDQVICAVQRLSFKHPFGYQAGQVCKKIIEAGRLFEQGKTDAAYAEVCGAVNYAAAMGIMIKEMGGLE